MSLASPLSSPPLSPDFSRQPHPATGVLLGASQKNTAESVAGLLNQTEEKPIAKEWTSPIGLAVDEIERNAKLFPHSEEMFTALSCLSIDMEASGKISVVIPAHWTVDEKICFQWIGKKVYNISLPIEQTAVIEPRSIMSIVSAAIQAIEDKPEDFPHNGELMDFLTKLPAETNPKTRTGEKFVKGRHWNNNEQALWEYVVDQVKASLAMRKNQNGQGLKRTA